MVQISCIIVNYNNKNFLIEAVESVLKQTLSAHEIIIADDASTDGSKELIESIARKHPKIKPILREKNIGVARNRDLAIRQASGDLITTLDSDDYYFPKKLEAEFSAMRNHSCNIGYSNVRLLFESDGKTSIINTDWFSKLSKSEKFSKLIFHSALAPRDPLFAKSTYLAIGGIRNLRLYEDWDFKLRLASYTSRWMHSGIEGLVYRRTGLGLSSSSPLVHASLKHNILWENRAILIENMGFISFLHALLDLYPALGRAFIKKIWANKLRKSDLRNSM
jgi:glycosyltransferase involved in cell wall biosynthesis